MESAEAKLIAEQLGRLADTLNSRMDALETSIKHHQELDGEKIRAIRDDLARLNELTKDHETRIRSATDGVTSFRVWSGLASGGSSVVAIIAFIKSFLP